MTKVLVTGGAGFVGSHLCDALIAEGERVTVLDNLSTGRLENINHLLSHHDFRFVHGTILDSSALEPLIQETDVIYHLAAVVGVKWVVDDPLGTIRTNLRGTEVVMELAFHHGCRVVFASSSEVYGKSEAMPFHEDGPTLLGPTTASRWSYALTKALDEHVVLSYGRRGLPVSIVRYFNSYGPRLDPRGYGSVLARFIDQALHEQPLTVFDDGRQSRCFTYVSDTVRGTILAGTDPAAIGQVFNVGGSYEITISELAHKVIAVTGSRSPVIHVPYEQAYGPHFEETRRRIPDTSKAKQLLGFRVQVPLQEGLERTVSFFRTRGVPSAPNPSNVLP